jgi:hypothetical protein
LNIKGSDPGCSVESNKTGRITRQKTAGFVSREILLDQQFVGHRRIPRAPAYFGGFETDYEDLI